MDERVDGADGFLSQAVFGLMRSVFLVYVFRYHMGKQGPFL